MKHISVSSVTQRLPENCRSFSHLKYLAQSLCRPSDEEYGTVRSRLFGVGTGKIYSGLLPYVTEFLEEQGHAYTVSEEFSKRTLDKSTTTKFVQSLSTIKARDYQIDAVHNILESDRGLILSPTGSGKSFIIYALVRYYVQKSFKSSYSCSHHQFSRADVYRLCIVWLGV